jgi:putative ABC transport system substrate-binding protein
MQRRKFITLLGGSAVMWPLATRTQKSIRRVVVLMGTADDAEAKARASALQEGLQKLRWTIGRDIQVDYRFAAGGAERMRDYANEAVASGPDLLLAQTNPALQALQKATRTLPIVFLQVSDPVGGGFVQSLAHRGGNITGFTNFESEIGGKWLRTLKDIAPVMENVGFVLNPDTSAHVEFLRAAEAASVGTKCKSRPTRCEKGGGYRTRNYRVRLYAERRDDRGTSSHNQRKADYRPSFSFSTAYDLSFCVSCA